MFHNSIQESGAALKALNIKAGTQDARVLAFFIDHPAHLYTPAEVHAKAMPDALLTSVRRAMSNLTRQGHLEKTQVKASGRYGVKNFLWRLKRSGAAAEQMTLWA